LNSSYSVSFITLGCAKNEVDSDKMRVKIRAAGFREIADPVCADVVIINTCAFITEATEEAIATIFEALDLPRLVEGSSCLVVTGCMPSRYGAKLVGELPEVAAFVSCAEEENIVEILCEVLARRPMKQREDPPITPGDFTTAPAPATAAPAPAAPASAPAAPDLTSGAASSRSVASAAALRTVLAPWAYVKIADGCNRFCSFCTIPHIRGRYRSMPTAAIVAEVAELVAGGVREIVLIAQDTGIWGQDRKVAPGEDAVPEAANLAALLDLLAARFSKTWFRVMYLQPQGITDELLAVMARYENICNYLDIPLQHASARVLREMNRTGDGNTYLALLSRVRQALPDVALRTTFIAGFPGETRADVRELERFIEKAAFDYVGVFLYSQEDGTVAGRRDDQVPLRTRRARAQRLRDLADSIGFARVAARVGTAERVLVIEHDEDEDEDEVAGAVADGGGSSDQGGDQAIVRDEGIGGGIGVNASKDGGPLLGRTMRQAPEVDGMVHLDQGHIGEVLSVTMVESYCYELDGKVKGASHV
jgi:ribosomal protein S12 methylthiotransferase